MSKLNINFNPKETLNIKVGSSNQINADFNAKVITSTSDYNELVNKPKINDVELVGNKTSKELKLQEQMNEMTFQDIDDMIYGG